MIDLRRAHRILLGLAFAASPAGAGTVIVDSDVAGPVNVISRDEIEVLPGASISGALEGIVGAGQNRVTIRREGRVEGTLSGVDLAGDDFVLNQGRILGGVYGINFGGEAELVNSGKIEGGVYGIFGVDRIEVLNQPDGAIFGSTYGIQGALNVVLKNHGDVGGGTYGVDAGGNARIWNWGSIHGGVFGVNTIGLDLFNYGDVTGGVYGVNASGDAAIRNWGKIEGGVFGVNVFGDLDAWNWGRINGGTYGISTTGNAQLHNFNTIEGGVFGVNVARDADVWNYGRLTGGFFGLVAGGELDLRNWGYLQGGQFGLLANGESRVWNWGQIKGDLVAGIQATDNLYLRNAGLVWGGHFGVYAIGQNNRIENYGAISGGDFGVFVLGNNVHVTNRGTITGEGPNSRGIGFVNGGDHRVDNFGVLRGGLASVELDNQSTLTLGGTGYYIGDVLGSVEDGDTLRLDLVGVPKEVKQSLLRRQGPLSGPLYIPVFNINAREFEELEIERLISFQEEAGGDFGSVGRSLDWRDIARDGSKSAFVEGFGELVGDRGAFRDALENVSGRALSHTASDMAFAGSYYWNQDIAHYFDLKRNKAEADAKSGLQTTGWDGFAKALGIFADQDRTSDRQDGDWTSHGAFVGGDYTCGGGVTLGGFGGYTRSEADVDDFGTTLSSDDTHGGVYAGYQLGKLSLDGALWYSNRDYDSKRVLELPTFSQRAQAKFEADQLTSYLRASYNWRPSFDDRWEISPRVSLSQSHLWLDGWKEDSTPSRLGLETEDQEADSLRSSLGARVTGRFDLGKLTLQPEFRVDWMHEFLDDGRQIDGRWASPAFQPFGTESEVGDRNSAIVGAGLTLHVPVCDCMKKLEFYAGYDTQLGRDDFKAQVANFRVSYQF